MRAAVLVSVPVSEDARSEVEAGAAPQRDYFALADNLGASIMTPIAAASDSKLGRVLNIFRAAFGSFRRHRQYDLVITDVDRVGLLLALLFRLAGVRKRHIFISHGELANSFEAFIVKAFGLHSRIDQVVCYGPLIARKLRSSCGFPNRKVVAVHHAGDHRFWRPEARVPDRLIASAGSYRRDYATLVEATRDQNVQLIVAHHSPWVASHRNGAVSYHSGSVFFVRKSARELRELYSRALFVAIPLFPSTDQAGSLVLYEAMAMGKAVVATRTAGLEALGVLEHGETGVFVSPGDVEGWSQAICYLLKHPEKVAQMGRRARTIVDKGLNLDGYVKQVVDIIHRETEPSPVQSPKARLLR